MTLRLAHHSDKGRSILDEEFRLSILARNESSLLHLRLVRLVERAGDSLGHCFIVIHADCTCLLEQLIAAFVLVVTHLLNLSDPGAYHATTRAQLVTRTALRHVI